MKKILKGILPIVLCFSLTACGGTGEKAFDPASDAETILASGAFDEPLTEVDEATACGLYSIDQKDVSSCAVYGSTSGADELAIFALSDAEAAKAAGEQFQIRTEDRMDELADYMPGEIPKLQKAVVAVRENTAMLVIASNYEPVESFLKK